MNFLLDTHAFIWFIKGDQTLPSEVKDKIPNINNKCCLSIASIWEIAIKISLNKLSIRAVFKEIFLFLDKNQINFLPIEFDHLKILMKLDFHHRDPFDRLIISQSISEDLTTLTKDAFFNKYLVKTFWQ
jgi:PIN domain nuclease of toxin-antitoxin system